MAPVLKSQIGKLNPGGTSMSGAESKQPLTVTINVPSPSPVIESAKPYLSVEGKEELLASLGPAGSFEPLVGDVKLTLDDLKTSLLHYYSRLYAAEGTTIDERLNYLQQHFYPSPYPISGAYQPSVSLPNEQQVTPPTQAPYQPSPKMLFGPNFLGALYPSSAPSPEDLVRTRPDQTRESIEPYRGHAITEVIEDMKRNVGSSTRQLIGITDAMMEETEDPNKRAFSYLTFPKSKRRPYFGTQQEMEDSLVHLYKDLYTQVQWNERRIQALRHRLTSLQMNTIGSMNRWKTDPRLGY